MQILGLARLDYLNGPLAAPA